MELNQVVQRKKDGKLFVVVGKAGKFFLELKAVTTINIQLNVDDNQIAEAYHNSEFEPAKVCQVSLAGIKLNQVQ